MKRLIGYLVRVGLFIAVAVWLADQPGTAHIEWHGYIIETSAAFLGLAILVFAFALYTLFRFWHIISNGPELWRLRRHIKKTEQGQALLTQGLSAVAAGHAAEAGRLALAARKKLGTTTSTLLLQAQAARLSRDHRSARAIFRAMIEIPESRVLGYRGLIMEARREGEWPEVERLTHEVRELKIDVPWLDQIAFESATRRKEWASASEALAKLQPTQLIDSKTMHRHRAALYLAQSLDAVAKGAMSEAQDFAEQAAKHAPDWLPALINLARRQTAGEHNRAARRTIEKGWTIQHHAQLAETLRHGERNPVDGYKHVEKLCRHSTEEPVSQMAMGEAATDADIWGEARRHLMMLVNGKTATQNTYRLLAKIEKREKNDERASLLWLTKAAEAIPDPTWLCSACGAAHQDWVGTCRSCGHFDTLDWRSPGVSHQDQTGKPPITLLSHWSE